MKILIIGASGLVGGACFRFLSNLKMCQVTGTYRNYKSISANWKLLNTETNEGIDLLEKHWDVVIHTAALTNVDLCELNPHKSYLETVTSTEIIVNSLQKHNPKVKLIYISTDYIFDGVKGPYFENATPNPINVYGNHKLNCESLVLNNLIDSVIVRVTNVYGEEDRNKNFIARIISQLERGEKISIKVPNDQFATPIWAYDIARVIWEIISKNLVGIFHASGNDYLNRYQLARKLAINKWESKLEIFSLQTSEFNQVAPRPLKGGLICSRLYQFSPNFLFTSIDQYINRIYNELQESHE